MRRRPPRRSIDFRHQARRRLDTAAAKSSFLSSISHEIRAPLNALESILQLLKVDAQSERVDLLHNADDLTVLINEILDFSKIEAGEMNVELAEFAGLDLAEDISNIHSNTAHENNLDIICIAQPGEDFIGIGDPRRPRHKQTPGRPHEKRDRFPQHRRRRFNLLVHRAKKRRPSRASFYPPHRALFKKSRALIVDRSAASREALQSWLLYWDFECNGASHFQEAKKRLDADADDFI